MIPKRRDNKEEEEHRARAVNGIGMLRKLSDSIILTFLQFLSSSLLCLVSNICIVLAEDLLKTTLCMHVISSISKFQK